MARQGCRKLFFGCGSCPRRNDDGGDRRLAPARAVEVDSGRRLPRARPRAEEVLEAARRARERGVTVQILDDRRQDLEPRTLAGVSEDVAGILDGVQTGTVTARARPQDDPLAATIYASGADRPDEPTLLGFPER
jgi:hypothetical protein